MNEDIKNYIDEQIQLHEHNGNQAPLVNLFDVSGNLQTITDATTLTNVTAGSPTNVYGQIFIDTSTGTKKLYIYDFTGKAWLSIDGLTTH